MSFNLRPMVRSMLRSRHRAYLRESLIQVVSDGRIRQDATLTRADPAKYFDSSGLLQTAAANEARTTYIDGVPYLWIDRAVTEISGRSFDPATWNDSGAAQVAKDIVGLDGETNSGFTVTDSSDSVSEPIQQTTTIASGSSPYYLVCAIKQEVSPSTYPAILARLQGGTARQAFVALDRSDGSLAASHSGGEVVLDPLLIGDFWHFVLGVTDNATGNNEFRMRVEPARNSDGTTNQDVTAQGSIGLGYCAQYKDNFSLMPILTTGGTTKTVAADVASLANSVISGLTEGTLYMEIWTPQLTSNAARHIAELESDASNFIRVLHAADGDLDAQITDGGASQAALAGTDLTVGQLQKVALSFGPGGFRLVRDGTLLDSGTGTVPSVDTLLIGAGLHGGIRNMDVATREWSQTEQKLRTA